MDDNKPKKSKKNKLTVTNLNDLWDDNNSNNNNKRKKISKKILSTVVTNLNDSYGESNAGSSLKTIQGKTSAIGQFNRMLQFDSEENNKINLVLSFDKSYTTMKPWLKCWEQGLSLRLIQIQRESCIFYRSLYETHRHLCLPLPIHLQHRERLLVPYEL